MDAAEEFLFQTYRSEIQFFRGCRENSGSMLRARGPLKGSTVDHASS